MQRESKEWSTDAARLLMFFALQPMSEHVRINFLRFFSSTFPFHPYLLRSPYDSNCLAPQLAAVLITKVDVKSTKKRYYVSKMAQGYQRPQRKVAYFEFDVSSLFSVLISFDIVFTFIFESWLET